jgi:nicotinamidase-related amidase
VRTTRKKFSLLLLFQASVEKASKLHPSINPACRILIFPLAEGSQKMINYKTATYSCLQAAINAILSAVDIKRLKTLGGYAYESD